MQNIKWLPNVYNLYMELYDRMKGPRRTAPKPTKRRANGAARRLPAPPPEAPTPPAEDDDDVLEDDEIYDGETDEKRLRYNLHRLYFAWIS